MYRVSLIIPTYNERENVPILLEEIFSIIESISEIELEIIIVDDNSPDGTGEIAEKMSNKYPVKVIHRNGKKGLGSAVMEGFALSKNPYVGVMDADLSHDPSILPEMIKSINDYDIIIGSRFNAQSYVENWRIDRKITSIIGVWLAKQLTSVSDPLSGYFLLKRKVISEFSLVSPGYKILLEILVKGNYSKIKEVPFRFRTREHSVSKLSSIEYFYFIKQLIFFYKMKFLGKKGVKKK